MDHYNLKPSMVSRLLFVSAAVDTLESHNSGYLYGFKVWNSHFFKSLSNEVYLSCLDFEMRLSAVMT